MRFSEYLRHIIRSNLTDTTSISITVSISVCRPDCFKCGVQLPKFVMEVGDVRFVVKLLDRLELLPAADLLEGCRVHHGLHSKGGIRAPGAVRGVALDSEKVKKRVMLALSPILW